MKDGSLRRWAQSGEQGYEDVANKQRLGAKGKRGGLCG